MPNDRTNAAVDNWSARLDKAETVARQLDELRAIVTSPATSFTEAAAKATVGIFLQGEYQRLKGRL